MLIVNADDFGMAQDATDNIVVCYRMGRITSTSAMAFMADSGRAASLARELCIPVGLHLNLSQAFTAADVPATLQEHHRRVRVFLSGGSHRPVLFQPWLCKSFEYTVRSQRDAFQELYGHGPTHIDGHHHMHLCSHVVIQRLIPRGTSIRTTFTFARGEKGTLNLLWRAAIARWVSWRYSTTDRFYSLSRVVGPNHVRPEVLEAIVRVAQSSSVELSAHPQWPHELRYLMSDDYGRQLNGVQTGSYATLTERVGTTHVRE